jgi:acyl-CoA thioesterase-2
LSAFAKLLARLDLPREDETVFVGGAGVGGVTDADRLFGGLVLAQATVAAARTVPDMSMHSLHAYFLRPGRPDEPIRLAVDPIKEGRNFRARMVTAGQGDDTILTMQASFSGDTPSVEHQDVMPAQPPPESLPNRDQLRGRANWRDMAIDVRLCDPLTDRAPLPPTKAVWMKPYGVLPEDPILHLALLVYATDRAFLSTAWRPHANLGELRGASLDHSLWFHDRIDFSDWHLYQMHSPAARFERGLVQGAIYNHKGQRTATAAQEGALRFRAREPTSR